LTCACEFEERERPMICWKNKEGEKEGGSKRSKDGERQLESKI